MYSLTDAAMVQLGQVGSGHLDGGESAASIPARKVIIAITVLEGDTTFTTLTQESAEFLGTGTSTHGNSLVNSDTYPAGVTIYGRWTALTVNAGSVVFYIGP